MKRLRRLDEQLLLQLADDQELGELARLRGDGGLLPGELARLVVAVRRNCSVLGQRYVGCLPLT